MSSSCFRLIEGSKGFRAGSAGINTHPVSAQRGPPLASPARFIAPDIAPHEMDHLPRTITIFRSLRSSDRKGP